MAEKNSLYAKFGPPLNSESPNGLHSPPALAINTFFAVAICMGMGAGSATFVCGACVDQMETAGSASAKNAKCSIRVLTEPPERCGCRDRASACGFLNPHSKLQTCAMSLFSTGFLGVSVVVVPKSTARDCCATGYSRGSTIPLCA